MSAIDQATRLALWPAADAKAALQELEAAAEQARAARDLDRADKAVARLAGVRRRGARLGVHADVQARLAQHIAGLERHRDMLAAEAAAATAARRREGARERVRACLMAPRRPVEVAEELGMDPANIARAIRELRASGTVVEVPASTGDRRARTYVATSGIDAEIARTQAYLSELRALAASGSTSAP